MNGRGVRARHRARRLPALPDPVPARQADPALVRRIAVGVVDQPGRLPGAAAGRLRLRSRPRRAAAACAGAAPRHDHRHRPGPAGVACSAWPSPVTPGDGWKPDPDASPVTQILLLLTGAIGLPFLLLASTSPLLQRWYADRYPDRSPYRLYALSNLGSLAGLVSYPLARRAASRRVPAGPLVDRRLRRLCLGHAHVPARDARRGRRARRSCGAPTSTSTPEGTSPS